MNSIVKTAKTVNEAIEAALKELNATRDMVDVEVQEESKSGFLGFLGSRNAVVKVTLKEVVEENKDFNAPCDFKSEYVEKDEPEALEFAKKYLLDMLKQLDITANIEIKKDFENEKVDFVIKDVLEERVGAVIGKRGESKGRIICKRIIFSHNEGIERIIFAQIGMFFDFFRVGIFALTFLLIVLWPEIGRAHV